MFELTINTQGLMARRKKLEQARQDFPANFELFVVNAGKVYQTNLRRKAPRSHTARPDPDRRKTMLHGAEGINTGIEGGGNFYRIFTTTKAPYMVFQARGTRGHTIFGREGDLKFFWEKEGLWFRGPSVNHPGFKETDFDRKAFEWSVPEFQAGIRELAGKLGTR